ncbi:MAG: hypothetical protein H5U40_02710, partial [Polyangiaceae bacterium]|nr:hypothetical protein [Polyangiaceae bacterium]
MPSELAREALEELARLYRLERDTTVRRAAEERSGLTLTERVAKGLALSDLEIEETDAAAGGRLLAWLRLPKNIDLDDLRIRTGDPVRLWWNDPNGPEAVLAVVQRRGERLGAVLDSDVPERLFEGVFHLDRDAPQVTFERAERAIASFIAAERGEAKQKLADIFFGERRPAFAAGALPAFFDGALEEAQRQAVSLAVR